jgi:hypothetical protein
MSSSASLSEWRKPWTRSDVFGVVLIIIGIALLVFFSVWTQIVRNHAKKVGEAIFGLNNVADMAVATAKGVSQGLSNAAAAASASEDANVAGSSTISSLLSVFKK